MSESRSGHFSAGHQDWVDGTRSLAALAVVLLHAAASTVNEPSLIGSAGWWLANALDSAVRWCVPVFVMLSGALLLSSSRQEETWQEFYRRRFMRLLVPLVFWSVFYLAYDALCGAWRGREWNGTEVLHRIAVGRPYFHLWYLYMLPGLYLATPLLRQLVAILSVRQLQWLCAAILGLAAANEIFSAMRPAAPIFFGILFLPYLGYFLAGYLLLRQPPSGHWPWPVWVLSSVITAWAVYRLTWGGYFYEYLSVSVIPMGLAVFALCTRLPALGVFRKLAPLSLGIYLLHPLWLDIVWQLGLRPGSFHPALSIPALTLGAVLCSAIGTALLLRIPVLRKTV